MTVRVRREIRPLLALRHRSGVVRLPADGTSTIGHVVQSLGVPLTRRGTNLGQRHYTWQRRFDAEGVDGLKARSRRPRTSPNATHTELVRKIIYLRRNYGFGPGKISMYLQRYHQVKISNSGVWRILKRLEMNPLPASQKHKAYHRRWKRYQKQLPGHRVQIDVKFIEPLPPAARSKRQRRFYQFTAARFTLRTWSSSSEDTSCGRWTSMRMTQRPAPGGSCWWPAKPGLARRRWSRRFGSIIPNCAGGGVRATEALPPARSVRCTRSRSK
jgi:transposase